MKGNVPVAEAISDVAVLPDKVQEALGELVGAAREGLLALSVEVGLGGGCPDRRGTLTATSRVIDSQTVTASDT